MRLSFSLACFLVAVSSFCVQAQEGDSLGDLARRARGQKDSGNQLQVTLSQCTEGPISLAQIFAWQVAGMASPDIAKAISSRGVSFDPNSGSASQLLQNMSSPDVAAAIASAQQSLTEGASVTVLKNLSHAAELVSRNDYRNALLAMQDVWNETPLSTEFSSAVGSLLMRTRDFDKAKRAYDQAARLADNCAYVHAQLSSVYYALEDGPNAESEARKVLALTQGSSQARQLLTRAHALRIQAEHENIPPGEDVDDSEYQNDAHQQVTNEALHYNRAGIAKENAGNSEGAVKDYQQAIAAEPRWWSPRYNLGNAYINLGRFQDALASFQQAKSLSPDHLNIRQNVGYCLCKLNRWNEAINEFQGILKIDPTWNMARPCLYDALKAVHRDNEAEQVYQDEQKYKAMGYDD